MNNYLLKKEDLPAFLKDLNLQCELWAPYTESGIRFFHPYREGEQPECGRSTRISVKSFFLPRCEEMFQFSPEPDGMNIQANLPENRLVLFGVRPCDARAMRLNARVFLDDPATHHQDPYFGKRRQTTLLVGWGCDRPGAACFCHAVGGSPFGEEGLDALITDLGDNLLLTVGTPEAEKRIKTDQLRTASEEDMAAAERINQASRETLSANFNPENMKIESIVSGDIETLFDLPVWEETASRCLNCGVCTYLCPTCTCFDVLDTGENQSGYQFRCWDSCMFGLFTQHASGHNPRPGKPERIRQRFMHKLRYFPERNGGHAGCVGCGRCVLFCPVNIDIREIAESMAESKTNR